MDSSKPIENTGLDLLSEVIPNESFGFYSFDEDITNRSPINEKRKYFLNDVFYSFKSY